MGETLKSYDSLTEPEGVFVVIKFAQPAMRPDGGNVIVLTIFACLWFLIVRLGMTSIIL